MLGRSSREARPIPAHPYRDTAIVYGIMAGVLVVVAAVTGGDVLRAGLVAVVFFVVATAWTSWRFRTRIRERDAARAAAALSAGDGGGGGSTDGNGRGGSGA
jgi:hypothetical protein